MTYFEQLPNGTFTDPRLISDVQVFEGDQPSLVVRKYDGSSIWWTCASQEEARAQRDQIVALRRGSGDLPSELLAVMRGRSLQAYTFLFPDAFTPHEPEPKPEPEAPDQSWRDRPAQL